MEAMEATEATAATAATEATQIGWPPQKKEVSSTTEPQEYESLKILTKVSLDGLLLFTTYMISNLIEITKEQLKEILTA